MHHLSRREVLRKISTFTILPFLPNPTLTGRSVAIIGSGLAGLSAAYDLLESGWNITILEARSRPGGRVLTLRQPFSRGLYAEAGAMYTNDKAENVLRHAQLFGISLRPVDFSNTRRQLFYIQGKEVLTNSELNWPPGLSDEEKSLGVGGMWDKYVTSFARAIGPPNQWPNDLVVNLEKMSFADFLAGRGASPAAISILRLGYPDSFGEGINKVAALQFLRIFALDAYTTQAFVIEGGSDRLSQAFASKLHKYIQYNCKVFAIREKAKTAEIDFLRNGKKETISTDQIICTLPLPLLKTISFAPTLSSAKAEALASIQYTSVTRVYLEVKNRTWIDHLGDFNTDLPIMRVIEHPIGRKKGGSILEAFMSGQNARSVAAMNEKARISFVKDQIETVNHGVKRAFIKGSSYCWDHDEFARGAFSSFKPHEISQYQPALIATHGRVHFAGEHTSTRPATMEGALESGTRAAKEVSEST